MSGDVNLVAVYGASVDSLIESLEMKLAAERARAERLEAAVHELQEAARLQTSHLLAERARAARLREIAVELLTMALVPKDFLTLRRELMLRYGFGLTPEQAIDAAAEKGATA